MRVVLRLWLQGFGVRGGGGAGGGGGRVYRVRARCK